MAEKEIALLKTQIENLSHKKFDLEAWKNHTLIFIERIFGKDSSKITMIKDLSYDYSSWSLRDTAAAGKTKDSDPIRLQAKEILDASIAELQNLGLPVSENTNEKIWSILEDELTGKQIRELKKLVKSKQKDKESQVTEMLDNLEKDSLVLIISKLLI